MSESIIEWKPRPRDRVFIRLSGGRFFTVPQAETLPLEAGAVLSEREIEQLSRMDQYFRGREKSLRLLSIRARTRYEIKNALDGIGVTTRIRDGILDELTEQGFLDDRRFARNYVESRIELKHLGPHRLRFELKKLGLHAAVIDAALSEVTGESQESVARDLIRRKLGARRPDEGDIRRLSALLRRKGMDYEVINRVTYELWERARQDDSLD